MHRREFVILGSAAVAWPFTAWAQKETKPAYIGFISGLDKAGAATFIAAFRDGLAARGYAEPGTLKIDTLFADSTLDRIPALVEDLERRHNATNEREIDAAFASIAQAGAGALVVMGGPFFWLSFRHATPFQRSMISVITSRSAA